MGPEANITTTVLHLAIPSVIEKHKQNQTNKQTNKQEKGLLSENWREWLEEKHSLFNSIRIAVIPYYVMKILTHNPDAQSCLVDTFHWYNSFRYMLDTKQLNVRSIN